MWDSKFAYFCATAQCANSPSDKLTSHLFCSWVALMKNIFWQAKKMSRWSKCMTQKYKVVLISVYFECQTSRIEKRCRPETFAGYLCPNSVSCIGNDSAIIFGHVNNNQQKYFQFSIKLLMVQQTSQALFKHFEANAKISPFLIFRKIEYFFS